MRFSSYIGIILTVTKDIKNNRHLILNMSTDKSGFTAASIIILINLMYVLFVCVEVHIQLGRQIAGSSAIVYTISPPLVNLILQ